MDLEGLNKSNERLAQGCEASCFESQNHNATKYDMKMISDCFYLKKYKFKYLKVLTS